MPTNKERIETMESHELRTLCIDAIAAACVSRGKRKGALKAVCPPSHTDAAAAWQTLMLEANPYKASIAARLFWTERQRAISKAIEASLVGIDVRGMDKDRVALERLGAW
jgi:hypothetical protein